MVDEGKAQNIAIKNLSILNAVAVAINTMNSEILHLITADDSEDDEPIIRLLSEQLIGRNTRVLKTRQLADMTISRFKDKQFQHYFRLSKSNFENLLTKLCPLITHQGFGRPAMTVQKQLMIAVSLLVKTDSFSLIGERFGVTKATVEDCFQRIIIALQKLAKSEIVWPSGSKVEKIVSGFNRSFGFPGVLGVIGTVHIPIKPPHDNPEAYMNHKKHYSIVLQAVCNNDLSFISCFSEHPGSTPALQVFEDSALNIEIESDPNSIVPEGLHIIGNSLYPLKPWLMVPFHDNEQFNQCHINYNLALTNTHETIKNAFALFKGRLRKLTFLDMSRTDLISVCVMACCVLHNIALTHDDNIHEYIEEGMKDEHYYPEDLCLEHHNTTAIKKRESLAKYFK